MSVGLSDESELDDESLLLLLPFWLLLLLALPLPLLSESEFDPPSDPSDAAGFATQPNTPTCFQMSCGFKFCLTIECA